MKIRWILPVFVVTLFLHSAMLPGDEDKGKAPKHSPQWLALWAGSNPTSFNPLTTRDANASRIKNDIFERLLKTDLQAWDPDLKTYGKRGLLAETWEVSENTIEKGAAIDWELVDSTKDGKPCKAYKEVKTEKDQDNYTITFRLRKNVKFSDGEPMDADDVVFTWRTRWNPFVDNPHLKAYMTDVNQKVGFNGLEKIDQYTVKFHMKTLHFNALSNAAIAVMPEHVYGIYGADGEGFMKGDKIPGWAGASVDEDVDWELCDHGHILAEEKEAGGGEKTWVKVKGPRQTKRDEILKTFADAFNTHARNLKPLGSGPYTLEEYARNEKIVLARNPDYWNAEEAEKRGDYRIEKKLYRIIEDRGQMFQAALAGELDGISMNAEQWDEKTSDPEFTDRFAKFRFYSASYGFVGWNMSHKLKDSDTGTRILHERDVRVALTYMTNRPRMLEEISRGHGKVVTGPFYFELGANDSNLRPRPFDTERAVAKLEKAGWMLNEETGIREKEVLCQKDDGTKYMQTIPLSIRLMVPSSGGPTGVTMRRATMMKEDFKKGGVELIVESVEWTVFTDRLDKQDFQACILAWRLALEPDPYQIWHSSQTGKSGSNFVNFIDEEMDAWIVEGRRTMDPVKRAEIFRKVHRRLYREQPYTFMFTGETLMGIHKRIGNVKAYPVKGVDRNEWFIDW
jgi:ABC-type transport system substrate-binding protein